MAQTKSANIDELTTVVRKAASGLSAHAVSALVAHPDAVTSALALTASMVGIDRIKKDTAAEKVGGSRPILVGSDEAGRRLDARTKPRNEQGLLGSDELAAKAGLKTRQSVHDWLKKRRIVGWEQAKRGYVFPEGQLDERGRPLAGIDRIVELFPDGYAAWVWLTTPLSALDGAKPLSLLKNGEIERVTKATQGDVQGDFA